MRPDEELASGSRDTLALSFLDVLSCGLGGAIYLFLIFSVLPHLGAAGASPLRGAAGLDARGQEGGVRLDDFEDRVRSATIQIEVRFLQPLPPRTRLQWKGLPRERLLFTEQDSDKRIRSLSALVDGGLEPGERVTVLFPADALQARVDGEVSVFVGGLTWPATPVSLQPEAPIDGMIRLCEVKFGPAKLEVIP